MAKIVVVGGTGDLGRALALAWCRENQVVVGSRNLERAMETVTRVRRRMNELGLGSYSSNLLASTNREAVRNSDLVVLSVPHNVDEGFILELGRNIQPTSVVVSPVSPFVLRDSCFEPVVKVKAGRVVSFAEWVGALIGTEKVVSTLQTFPALRFYREGPVQCDVPVAGDEPDAVKSVMRYLTQIEGVNPIHVGPLSASLQLEVVTCLLLNLQRFSKIKSPTVRFV